MNAADKGLREQLSRACSLADICFASLRLRPLSPDGALATLEAVQEAAIEAIPISPLRREVRNAFGANGSLCRNLQVLPRVQFELFCRSFASVDDEVWRFAITKRQKVHHGERQRLDSAIFKYLQRLISGASSAVNAGGQTPPPGPIFDERFKFHPKEWFATSASKRAVYIIHEARLLHLWKSVRELLRPFRSRPELPRPQRNEVETLHEHLRQFLVRSSSTLENLAGKSQREWSLPKPMRRANAAVKQVSPFYDELRYVQSRLDELVVQFDADGVLLDWLVERIETRMAEFHPVVQALFAGTSRAQLDLAAQSPIADLNIPDVQGTDLCLLGHCVYRVFNTSSIASLRIPDYGDFAAIHNPDAVISIMEQLAYGREEEFVNEGQEGTECRSGLAFRSEEHDEWHPLVTLSLDDHELRVLKMTIQLRRFEREVSAVSPKGVEHIAVLTARRVVGQLCKKYLDAQSYRKFNEGVVLDDEQTVKSLAELAVQLWYLRLEHGQLGKAGDTLLEAVNAAFSIRTFVPYVGDALQEAWNHLILTQVDGPLGQFSVDVSGPSGDHTVLTTFLPRIQNEFSKTLLSNASFHSAYASLDGEQACAVREFLHDLEAEHNVNTEQRTLDFLAQILAMKKADGEVYAAVVDSLNGLGFFPRRSDSLHLLKELGECNEFVLELSPVDDGDPHLALTMPGRRNVAPARIVLECPTTVYEHNRQMLDKVVGLPVDADQELLTLRRSVVEEVLGATEDLDTSIENCVRTWATDRGGAAYIARKACDGRSAEADEILQILASTGAAPPAETSVKRLANVEDLRCTGIQLNAEQTQRYLFGGLTDELVIGVFQTAQAVAGEDTPNPSVIDSLGKLLESTKYHIIPEGFDPATKRIAHWTGGVTATRFFQEVPAGEYTVRRIGVRTDSRELLPCEVFRSAGPVPVAYHELLRLVGTVAREDSSLSTRVLSVAEQWPVSSLDSDSRHQHWFSYELLDALREMVLDVESVTEDGEKREEFHNEYYDLLDHLAMYVSERWGLRLDVVTSKQLLGTGWQRYVDFTDGREEWPESLNVLCVRPCLLKADGNGVVHKGIIKTWD